MNTTFAENLQFCFQFPPNNQTSDPSLGLLTRFFSWMLLDECIHTSLSPKGSMGVYQIFCFPFSFFMTEEPSLAVLETPWGSKSLGADCIHHNQHRIIQEIQPVAGIKHWNPIHNGQGVHLTFDPKPNSIISQIENKFCCY